MYHEKIDQIEQRAERFSASALMNKINEGAS